MSAPLTETPTDGVVTINLADGTVNVRLDGPLGGTNGLNTLGPNTELVLNATVVSEIVSRVGTLLDGWSTRVATATAPAVKAMSTLASGLSRVLALAVNVQPDEPNAPPTPTARAGEYQVSALRVRLVNAGIDAAAVWSARSWAGPNPEP